MSSRFWMKKDYVSLECKSADRISIWPKYTKPWLKYWKGIMKNKEKPKTKTKTKTKKLSRKINKVIVRKRGSESNKWLIIDYIVRTLFNIV
jgi:hypothetical protein